MSTKPRSVLIVDDDPDTLQILTTIVENLGHKLIACPTPKMALEAVEKQPFDLGLIDIMLPIMNGYELMGVLKSRTPDKHVPIILITAKDDDSDIYLGYQSGADYYMTKPFTPKQLENGLRLFFS